MFIENVKIVTTTPVSPSKLLVAYKMTALVAACWKFPPLQMFVPLIQKGGQEDWAQGGMVGPWRSLYGDSPHM